MPLETVYTTGQFDGTADFNPGSAKFNLTAPSGQEEAYVSKLDSAGNFVWAKAFAGSSSTNASSTSSSSQSLNQILAAFQTTGTQSDSFNPMAIMLNTLSNSGLSIPNA